MRCLEVCSQMIGGDVEVENDHARRAELNAVVGGEEGGFSSRDDLGRSIDDPDAVPDPEVEIAIHGGSQGERRAPGISQRVRRARVVGDQVDGHSDDLLELGLEVEQLEQVESGWEDSEDVQIASRPLVTSRDRSDDLGALDAVLGKKRTDPGAGAGIDHGPRQRSDRSLDAETGLVGSAASVLDRGQLGLTDARRGGDGTLRQRMPHPESTQLIPVHGVNIATRYTLAGTHGGDLCPT